jgi:hypothetical protein
MIYVAILAGTGLTAMSERVVTKIVLAPQVTKVWILTPRNRYLHANFFIRSPKLVHINSWEGPDSHDATGRNRERLRCAIQLYIQNQLPPYPEWIWFGDEDALPADDFFEQLELIRYQGPVLLSGRTFNSDGKRWYDVCCFQTDGHPFCVPYESWASPRWARDLYLSGNQHIINWPGFCLNVPYPDIRGEDPHYCWAFKKAGGKLIFRPELSCTLQKFHAPANYGYAPVLPI